MANESAVDLVGRLVTPGNTVGKRNSGAGRSAGLSRFLEADVLATLMNFGCINEGATDQERSILT
jgi:hypothetical protein